MITATDIAAVVEDHLRQIASHLRPDVLAALQTARQVERNKRAQRTLDLLIENAHIAATDDVPLCQDTGTVWVSIEVGEGEGGECVQTSNDWSVATGGVEGEASPRFRPECVQTSGSLQAAIDAVVSRVFASQDLRASTVRDALFDRSNPGTNTPAFVEIVPCTGPRAGAGVTVHTMLKGAGSDNASRVLMLSPDAGVDGVVDAVLSGVREKAQAACPPLIVGVGIGTTFDKVAALSKHALLRPLDQQSADPQTAALEARLLAEINATGIGPAALGGDTTALGVRLQTAPSHIAALPVAVNLCCHALRSRSTILPS